MENKNLFADMHIHSSYSDGSLNPSQIVEYAARVPLSAIALTDHDCIDGIAEAVEAGAKNGVEIIAGVELSTKMQNEDKMEIHILGYYIDYKSAQLKKELDIFKAARLDRAWTILSKLEKIGISLKDKSFVENAKNTAVGRLHFAKALVKEGHALNIQDAFYKYLSCDRPAYVHKFSLSPSQAIKLILDFGGIPVIAHPYYIPYDNKEMFQTLVKDGLMGIEVWHTKHPRRVVDKLIEIAQEFDLLTSGGSDCHGPYKNEKAIMGKIKVPYEIVQQFKNRTKTLKQL